MMIDNIENKRKILENFLEICVFDGVNDETLTKSFEKSQISPKYQELIFENGVLSLIQFYISEIVEGIASNIRSESDFDNLKIREKIKFALNSLFEQQKNNQIASKRIFNFYFDVKNLQNSKYGPKPFALAFENALKIADQIWFLIGDKSTDYNYYTKRLTLAKIISKAFMVFVKDDSKNLQKTKDLIDCEIEKVMKFEKFKAKVKNSLNSQKNCEIKEKVQEFLCDKDFNIKNPKQFIKNLPFIRLFNN